MTKKETLIGLNLAQISHQQLRRLLKHFGKVENILKSNPEDLIHIAGANQNQAQAIRQLEKKDIDQELSFIKRRGLKLVTILDDDYPLSLKEIYAAPILLYVKGQLKVEDIASIAIVGSRRASYYGLNCAEKIAFQLADLGLVIVSGLAIGIDTRAHRGALKAKARTVAVMGSGFNHLYPAVNKGLAEEISENGAVISEFACTSQPLPYHFPRRNRLISGLSLGVLVIEAAQNSGALITADFALEQGREVFSLPGRIDSQNSFGTNSLIKQGAKLVSSAEDILEELNIELKVNKPLNFKKTKTIPELAPQEQVLYDLIPSEPLSLDFLIDRSKLNLPELMSGLLNLELKGMIQQKPGKQFVRRLS